MQLWAFWVIMAIIFAVAEMLTPTFFFFWFAIGAVATAILSLFISSMTLNIIIFIVISFILWISTRKIVKRLYKNSDPKKTYTDDLIGKEAKIIDIRENNKIIVSIKGDKWVAFIEDTEKVKINDTVLIDKRESNFLYVHLKREE
ncbi:NfeD family protein [Oceanotoga sp. DSM 15011]|jgi:membrane protein implicated in regulation of membrane protease activity|uniref:Membrane protein implicated in regulation of membrane protease activity n=1 Tax=Oceanotoga teriensis TaxID=515440 RepID=A0AA45HJS1_9BACT|nr:MULTISPECIES: NfeD family protein [Oceanotoga]MDN5341622.1 hypothetical protein [Oceanotoga sp.]MDO7977175.1 NfeD family protein [Oceanotoga teriensis]PWJ96554.1 membrane protein implicated in regulation of membrane protease activity [Oceanotoga teriensis]UYP00272.1 NfeD family protein [Oceanotoga sp. DSM 15011]